MPTIDNENGHFDEVYEYIDVDDDGYPFIPDDAPKRVHDLFAELVELTRMDVNIPELDEDAG